MNDKVQEGIRIRQALNDPARHFRISDDVISSYDKHYSYIQHDLKLLRFSKDEIGAVSDCFILYAIARMGCADCAAIQNFLRALQKRHPGLSIADVENKDIVRKRLLSLTNNGFLFKHQYEVMCAYKDGTRANAVTLYTIDKDSQTFMNQKLSSRVPINAWVNAKPLSELIGWAAASCAGAKVANSSSFLEYKDGIFRSRSIGTAWVAMEVKTGKEEHAVYAAFIPAFLHFVSSYQTKDAFQDYCIYRINVIRNYFLFRDARNADSRMVVVVEDNADLMDFARLIVSTGVLLPELDRIYFTGEGALLNKTDISECFLRMSVDGANKIDFYEEIPDFIR